MNERTGNEIKKLPASKRYKPIKKITQQKKAGTYRAPIHSLGNNLAAVWIHHDHRDGRKLVGLGCLDGKRCISSAIASVNLFVVRNTAIASF